MRRITEKLICLKCEVLKDIKSFKKIPNCKYKVEKYCNECKNPTQTDISKKCKVCESTKPISEFLHFFDKMCSTCRTNQQDNYKERNKTASSVRNLIYQSFKRACSSKYRKSQKTEDILGCTIVEFMSHLSSLFEEGMTFENHGEWHIDHKIPLTSAKEEEDIKKLCHYTNLQPLWSEDNLSKGGKY